MSTNHFIYRHKYKHECRGLKIIDYYIHAAPQMLDGEGGEAGTIQNYTHE